MNGWKIEAYEGNKKVQINMVPFPMLPPVNSELVIKEITYLVKKLKINTNDKTVKLELSKSEIVTL